MKCKKCGIIKLSREFPSFVLDEDCDHPPMHCLQCVTSYWNHYKACSQCKQEIDQSSLNLRKCFNILETLFPVINPEQDQRPSDSDANVSGSTVTVARLDGEAIEIDYNPGLTIQQIKQRVRMYMKVEPRQQRLVFNGREMKDFQQDNKAATLSTYEVKPRSTIHLMVLLYVVPSNLNHVVFDLSWGYPAHGQDFLDASAIMFARNTCAGVVDYRHKKRAEGAIYHSGDLMDDFNQIGHHFINVELRRIPSRVTHIFFTLSAWHSPTISHYKNPSLRFYEKSNPKKMLCSDQTRKAAHRQAIIMCSLCKRDGQWFVENNGVLSHGNAAEYEPLFATIRSIIKTMG